MSDIKAVEQVLNEADGQKHHGRFYFMVRRFCRNKAAVAALFFILALIFCAVFCDYLTPYDYATQDLLNKLEGPSLVHLCGTDNFGRDIFTRILRGARVSLLVSLMGVCMSTVVAVILGSIAGYYGGAVDNVIMRIMDMLIAIPGLLLSMTVSASLGTGMFKTAIAMAIPGVAQLTRQLRSSIMTMKDAEYIEASRAFGGHDLHILTAHIIPNCLSPLIVQFTLSLGSSIMSISGLSFLGLGVQPPTPEWGNMVAAGQDFIRTAPHLALFPGLAVMLAMLAFNLLGDGLRDALDPRMKQ